MLNFIRKLLSKLYRKLGISADLGYIGRFSAAAAFERRRAAADPAFHKRGRLPRCPRNSGAGEKHADRT